jgi:predicted transposase/invertase (TIGR01784 family)
MGKIEKISYKGKELLPARVDLVFKALLTADGDLELLATLLSSILDLDIKSGGITVTDTELNPTHTTGKLARIDVRVKLADGKTLNIEIQTNEQNMAKRSIYYASKLYAEQMRPKMKYDDICPTIAINILDFSYLPFENYQNRYRLKNIVNNHELTDAFEIIFCELPKVPGNAAGSLRDLWMRFLAAKTEEELDMLAKEHPIMEKALNKLQYVSADEQLRYALDMREKAELDYWSDINRSYSEGKVDGKIEIAKNMLRRGRPINEIVEDTGLTEEEIEKL